MQNFINRWIFSTNHKDIGTFYLIVGVGAGFRILMDIIRIIICAGQKSVYYLKAQIDKPLPVSFNSKTISYVSGVLAYKLYKTTDLPTAECTGGGEKPAFGKLLFGVAKKGSAPEINVKVATQNAIKALAAQSPTTSTINQVTNTNAQPGNKTSMLSKAAASLKKITTTQTQQRALFPVPQILLI